MDRLKGILISVLCFDVFFASTSAGQLCGHFHDGTIIGKALDGYTYDSIPTCGYQKCISLCQRRQECRSVNYQRDQLLCELNTHTFGNLSMLTTRDGCIFKNMNGSTSQESGCQKSTCPPYHECLVLRNGTTVCAARLTSTTDAPSTTSNDAYVTSEPLSTTRLTSTTDAPSATSTDTYVTSEPLSTTRLTSTTDAPSTTSTDTYVTSESLSTTRLTSTTDAPSTTYTDTCVTSEPLSTTRLTSTTDAPSTTSTDTYVTSGPLSTTTLGGCVSPYTIYNLDLGACLYLSGAVDNWNDAESYCTSINGRLVDAENGVKQLAIGALIAPEGVEYWVGASWDDSYGVYVWFSGIHLITDPPLSEGCLKIDGSGVFFVDQCKKVFKYICEAI